MTNDVLLSMKGMQFGENNSMEERDDVEIITAAKYYQTNGSSYLKYDEILEGLDTPVSNMVKFNSKCIEVTKRGAINVHMVLEEGKQNITNYHTPYGDIVIGINTTSVEIVEQEDQINIKAEYDLDMNYEFLTQCCISMVITPKEKIQLS